MAALGLRDCQPRKKQTRYGVLWQPFEQLRRGIGKFEMTWGQRVVAQDVRLSTNDGDVSRPQSAPCVLVGELLQKIVQRGMTAREIGPLVILAQ